MGPMGIAAECLDDSTGLDIPEHVVPSYPCFQMRAVFHPMGRREMSHHLCPGDCIVGIVTT